MADKPSSNPRINKLIELEVSGRIKPEHQVELDTYRAQGVAPKKSSGNSLTEYQGKSTGFYERALGADNDFLAAKEGGDPVGYMGDAARAILPANVVNSWTSPERQKAQQAKEDFIRASLRYESGAAIGKDEFDAQDRIFFPQTGDSEEAIKQKALARQRVIESLKVAAGPGAAEKASPNPMDEIIRGNPLRDAPPLGTKVVTDPGVLVPSDVADKLAPQSLTSEQQAAYDAFNKANPNATAEQLRAFANSINWNLANADEIVKARDQGGGVASAANAIVKDPDISDVRGKGGFAEGADAAVRGAADTLSLGFADEITAAGKTIFSDGTMDENLRRERAIDRYDAENSPWLRGAGQFAGGLAFPIGRGATTVAELAGIGGLTGAGYGIGSGETWADRGIGGLTGGVAGTALGAGFGKLGEIWKNKRPPAGGPGGGAADTARDVAENAADLGIDILPADVGGPTTRRITAGAAQTPFGSGPILSRAQRATGQAQGVRDRVASSLASPTDDYAAGRSAQRGLTQWMKKSDTRAGRLYDAISVPSKNDASTSNTISALEQITQGMESNPELSRIWTGHPRLRATLDAIRRPEVRQTSNAVGYPVMQKKVGDQWVNLTQQEIDAGMAQGGGVSWEDMKRLRSIVGEIVGSPSLASEGNETAAMRKLYGALTDDMRATAERAGPKALREFERANDYFRARENRIKNVISPILGKDGDKGGQAAFNQIQNWSRAKGESARLAQMMRSLPEDEAETVAATVISKLGQSGAGGQNAAGDAFSMGQFLTHWNQLDNRAKSALFTPAQRAAMDKLAVVAEGTKEGQRFANTSNTAGALGANATTGGLAGAVTLALTGHPIMALAAASPAIGQYLTGRMMASPKFVNWLVRAPKQGPGLTSHIKKLGQISVKSPLLSSELAQFERALLNAANDNVGRSAAASDNQQEAANP